MRKFLKRLAKPEEMSVKLKGAVGIKVAVAVRELRIEWQKVTV